MEKSQQSLRKSYIKAYMQLLTQQAGKIDSYFFDDSEESDEIRPWFYWASIFGVVAVIFSIVL